MKPIKSQSKRNKKDVNKKRPDYKKWAKKWFKPGSNMIPPDTVGGFGPGKPLICDICKKRVYSLKGIIYKGELINICSNCKFIPEGE